MNEETPEKLAAIIAEEDATTPASARERHAMIFTPQSAPAVFRSGRTHTACPSWINIAIQIIQY